MSEPVRVLVAGIGGASLGTEIGKAVVLGSGYTVLGADISATAYGHYDPAFAETFLVEREDYAANIITLCQANEVRCVIPGAEQSMALLAASSDKFNAAGIGLAINDPQLVARMSNKSSCFEELSRAGVSIPQTVSIANRRDIDKVAMPCIVKPATGSGGSASVSFASNADEAWLFAKELLTLGRNPIAQHYLSHEEGEYTVGVLSLPSGDLVGSVALRRVFDNKLSVAASGDGYLISSGYSQGMIDDFPHVQQAAEEIARKIGSKGPVNIQGRVCDGEFLPFEINPRFSATTYLRAMAGFNEINLFLESLINQTVPQTPQIKPGWYLRSFTEVMVPKEKVIC